MAEVHDGDAFLLSPKQWPQKNRAATTLASPLAPGRPQSNPPLPETSLELLSIKLRAVGWTVCTLDPFQNQNWVMGSSEPQHAIERVSLFEFEPVDQHSFPLLAPVTSFSQLKGQLDGGVRGAPADKTEGAGVETLALLVLDVERDAPTRFLFEEDACGGNGGGGVPADETEGVAVAELAFLDAERDVAPGCPFFEEVAPGCKGGVTVDLLLEGLPSRPLQHFAL
ncbi:hypothetical protein GALMADRAFT_148234 [Galerina marginata CBS 339.88]|uniref:Uncharacterized protein n=1 Tax=Galerina marginata (strain CBS 339.88) TaxID=685588 RepID=A0A067S7S3_GALM3|nr:hypothetical protein GALMADRAFT_148234 [Galerina marginata CBS 339.88]